MKTLKRRIALLFLPVFFIGTGIFAVSCSDDDETPPPPAAVYTCEACQTTPEALAENDASVKGMYKGIIIGSTGTISINIQNGSNTITATMVLDGVTVLLTSNVSIVDGQPYIAPFTGTFNGSEISMTFSVGLEGSTPTMISSSIPGHPNAVFTLYKETSTSLIEAFEGTYAHGGDTGIFNIIVARSVFKWGYAEKNDQTQESSTGSGTLNSNGQLLDEDGDIIATITGDLIQGNSTDSNGIAVVIEGHRTL